MFVKQGGKYRLLALPAVYEMHFNASAWHYKIDGDVLKIEAGVPAHETYARLEISSKLGRHYDLLLTNELAMGEAEYLHPINLSFDGESAILAFDESTMAGSRHPEYRFRMEIETDGEWRYSGDEVFFEDGKTRRHPLLCVEIEGASKFSCTIFGLTTAQKPAAKPIKEMKEEYLALHRENTGGFRLEMDPENKASREIEKFNILVPWYLHNALIHFAMPHGLEQYGGGAWGTRDVCQGPAELFTAFGRFDLIKKIILKVYERQFHETGDWPQWFMFDASAASRRGQHPWRHHRLAPLSSRKLRPYRRQEILKEVIPYTTLTGKESIRKHPGAYKDNRTISQFHPRNSSFRLRGRIGTTPALATGAGRTEDDDGQFLDGRSHSEALETFLFSCDEEEDLRSWWKTSKDYANTSLRTESPRVLYKWTGRSAASSIRAIR